MYPKKMRKKKCLVRLVDIDFLTDTPEKFEEFVDAVINEGSILQEIKVEEGYNNE